MKKHLCRALLALTLALAVTGITLPTAWAAESEENAPLDCASALLMEAESGRVLFEYNADDRHAPASITKIMTMLLVCEAVDAGQISLDDTVTTSPYASSMGGSEIWLEPYETMTVDEMLRATAIASANDAAVALGEHLAGTEAMFADKMNQKAAQLGMDSTHFVNACGLDEEGHYTTARDIAVMARELLQHRWITDYTTVWQDTLRGGETELVNTNRLARFYDGCIGLKTGTTDDAGCCVCAVAERDGMTLIAVILGAPDSDTRFESAKSLLDYGFASYALAPAPEVEDQLSPVPVRHGTEPTVTPVPDAPEGILVEKARRNDLTCEAELLPEVEAPVEEGQVLGSVKVLLDGEALTEYDIIASQAVPRMEFSTAFCRLLSALCGADVE